MDIINDPEKPKDVLYLKMHKESAKKIYHCIFNISITYTLIYQYIN